MFRVKDEPREITIEQPAAIRQSSEPDIKVKPEPTDDTPFEDYRARSREGHSRSHTLEYSPRADSAPVKVEIKSEVSIRIKSEPEDNAHLLDCPPRNHVKVERDGIEAEGSTSRIRRVKAEYDDSASAMRGLPSRMESRVKMEVIDHDQSDGFRHPRPESRVTSTPPRNFRGKPDPEEDGWSKERGHERESTPRDYRGHRVDQRTSCEEMCFLLYTEMPRLSPSASEYRDRPKRESSPSYLEKRVRFKREHVEGEPRS